LGNLGGSLAVEPKESVEASTTLQATVEVPSVTWNRVKEAVALLVADDVSVGAEVP
jgi:hypothetical protein